MEQRSNCSAHLASVAGAPRMGGEDALHGGGGGLGPKEKKNVKKNQLNTKLSPAMVVLLTIIKNIVQQYKNLKSC